MGISKIATSGGEDAYRNYSVNSAIEIRLTCDASIRMCRRHSDSSDTDPEMPRMIAVEHAPIEEVVTESEDEDDLDGMNGGHDLGGAGGDLGSCWSSKALASALKGMNSQSLSISAVPPERADSTTTSNPELADVFKAVGSINFSEAS